MSVLSRSVPLLFALAAPFVGGCAGRPKSEAAMLPLEDPGPPRDTRSIEVVSMPITQLERRDVVDAVDGGLGRFLGYFVTEASLDDQGRFQGFRIVRINDPERFQGLGIGPGDVVTRINDQPIERPGEAYEAFVALRSAPSLDIAYLRGGQEMRLSLPIVGEAAQTPVTQESHGEPAPSSTREPSSPRGPSAIETGEPAAE